jgi:hypothetical protein
VVWAAAAQYGLVGSEYAAAAVLIERKRIGGWGRDFDLSVNGFYLRCVAHIEFFCDGEAYIRGFFDPEHIGEHFSRVYGGIYSCLFVDVQYM